MKKFSLLLVLVILALPVMADTNNVPVDTNAPPAISKVEPLTLLPQGNQPLQLAWGWENVTNLLSGIKRVDVDAGFAAHFDNWRVYAPSTAQHFNLATLHRGAWRWRMINILHADNFFQDITEDAFGFSTGIYHAATPKLVVDATGVVKPAELVDVADFTLTLGAYTETTHLFRASFESGSSGIRLAATFPMFGGR